MKIEISKESKDVNKIIVYSDNKYQVVRVNDKTLKQVEKAIRDFIAENV